MTTLAKPHGFATKSLHWLSAGLVAFGYYKGLNDVSELADPALFQFEIIFALVLGYSTQVLSGVFLTAMIALHEVVLTIMPLLLIAHIAGAIWHKTIRKDHVMESMTGTLPI